MSHEHLCSKSSMYDKEKSWLSEIHGVVVIEVGFRATLLEREEQGTSTGIKHVGSSSIGNGVNIS